VLTSVTVLTYPRTRAVGALRAVRAAARAMVEAGVVDLARGMQGSRFRPDTRLPYVPGRVALVAWAAGRERLDDASRLLDRHSLPGHVERWDVLLEPVRVHGEWHGVTLQPDAEPLRLDDPVVVLISGELRARYTLAFLRDNAEVGRQLQTAAGYLGGLGLADTPQTTTSLSCWRTGRESQRFAFAEGAHRMAYQVDQAEQRHRTELFVRFRPLRSAGTLDGRDPLAAVLRPADAPP
jgi:hypothetical protein